MTDTKALSNVEIKDASKGLVTAVVSTFGVIDLDGDVTSKATFTDGAPVVVSSYGHTSWSGDLPIGKGTISTTDTECIADLQLFMDTPHGAAAFNTIKGLGSLGEWSYSLMNTVSHRGELDGRPANFLDSTDVKEVSPVLRGASINTRTLSVKSDGMKFSDHVESVLADVDVLITRASEVMALRAEKGKTLSDESTSQLKVLRDRLGELVEPAQTPPDDTAADDLFANALVASLVAQGAP